MSNGERVSRGTFHSMAVLRLELEARIKALEARLAYLAEENEVLQRRAEIAAELLASARRETEEQRGRADARSAECDELSIEASELEAKLSKAEEMMRKAGIDPQTGRFQIVDEALLASKERDLDAYEAKLTEAEQRAARYEEALRQIVRGYDAEIRWTDGSSYETAAHIASKALQPPTPTGSEPTNTITGSE